MPRERALPAVRSSGHAGENTRERINHARALQAGAEHKHGTNHNRRAVTEDGECFICRENAGDQQHTHRAQRHQIGREPLAQEGREDEHDERENDEQMDGMGVHEIKCQLSGGFVFRRQFRQSQPRNYFRAGKLFPRLDGVSPCLRPESDAPDLLQRCLVK